jgi:AAA domain, putative AbiEii toxin, Type IV TA system
VIYAQVDGGFSVWDPARNYWRSTDDAGESYDRPPAYLFSARELWNGLFNEEGRPLCRGLIEDWNSWQALDQVREIGRIIAEQSSIKTKEDRPFERAFSRLRRVLERISPSESEVLVPGPPTRILLDDVRDMPTLHLHGMDIPLIHASAGIRRIVALCYLLVWTFTEHLRASELLEQPPVKKITFLIDEVDTHLHPRWQRRVLAALLEVVKELFSEEAVEVQLIAATHSPLVLASVEAVFDESKDQLWHLAAEAGAIELQRLPWANQGDVLN